MKEAVPGHFAFAFVTCAEMCLCSNGLLFDTSFLSKHM